MKKIIPLVLLISLILAGCTSSTKRPKYEYSGNYQLTYFYIQDCVNCTHFREDVLPIIEEEFGSHLTIRAYDMDDDKNDNEVKTVYDSYINNMINFDQETYGFGPLIILDDYVAILGAGNSDEFVENLSTIIRKNKIGSYDKENETIYYFKDGIIKQ